MQSLVRFIGVMLMLTALVVALTQAPDRSVDSLVARWALPPSDFMEVRGQLVHFRDEGPHDDPSPVLLLHGTDGSLHTWDGWAAGLRGRRRVITVDLPGAGLTGPFAGAWPRDDYRGDTLARFTLDVLDALHVRRFVVGGNAFGGEVAWRVATIAPGRVDRLILVDASGEADDRARLPLGFALYGVPVLGTLGEWLTPRPFIEQGLQAMYGDPSRVDDVIVDRTLEMLTREGNRRALGLRLRQAASDLAPARIRTLRVPTLILWGAADRQQPLAEAHEFERDIAGSRLVVLPGLGDLPQQEDPPRSLAPIRAFLGLDPAIADSARASAAAQVR